MRWPRGPGKPDLSQQRAGLLWREALPRPSAAVCYSNILEKMGRSSANAMLPGLQTREPQGASPARSSQAGVFSVCTWTEEADPKFARSLERNGDVA